MIFSALLVNGYTNAAIIQMTSHSEYAPVPARHNDE